MKRFLLASVATVGLTFAALPAIAQTVPTPASPPIIAPAVTPQPETEATEENAIVAPQVTPAQTAAEAEAAAAANSSAQPQLTGEGQVQATTPPLADTASAPQTPTPAAPNVAPMQAAAPQPQAQENAVLATPVSATTVCEQRTTSVHFGARSSALSRQNQNAIEYAADAASVCDLQTVTIVDSAEGRTSSRRAQAVRATLVRQGIPAERITVSQEANADAEAASTGRLDVRMAFAGVADGGSPTTGAAAPNAAPAVAPAPVPAPEAPSVATPQAPDTMTPPPAEGGPTGEEDTDPTPST